VAGLPGAKFGGSAGTFLSHITGMGDYKVTSNSFTMGNAVPSFSQSAEGMEVCHSEFLGDVRASNVFTATEYNVQPGLARSFPWLWNVARNFQEYALLGMVVHYKPSSGMISGTDPSLGMVILGTEYNVNAAGFDSKVQMETSQFCTSTVPFEPMTHPIECARGSNLLQTLLVRGDIAPTGGTLQLYDWCKFTIATQGMPLAAGNYTCGELWVSYHVRLKKPIQVLSGTPASYSHLVTSPTNTGAAGAPLGTFGAVAKVNSNLGVCKPSAAYPKFAFTLPTPGYYKVDVTVMNTGVDPTIPPRLDLPVGGNIRLIPTTYFEGLSSLFGVDPAFGASAWRSIFVEVTATEAGILNDIVIGGLDNLTNGFTDIYVTQYPKHDTY